METEGKVNRIAEKGRVMLNREYKSSLFADLFSDAKRGLSIFNALMGTDYSDPTELEIATLKDAVFMHRKNDVALLVEMRLLMLEHRSTINPNMPLRGLQYYADSMDGYLEKRQLNIYGKNGSKSLRHSIMCCIMEERMHRTGKISGFQILLNVRRKAMNGPHPL
jgi:hypothetical protein